MMLVHLQKDSCQHWQVLQLQIEDQLDQVIYHVLLFHQHEL